jgi:acyl-CoA dehydrogenase
MVDRDTVELTDQQRLVRDSIRELCAEFDAAYWRTRDARGEYPDEFVEELADNGWFGALIPEEYGGAGMGTEEAVVMMEEIAASGGGFSAAQAVHGAIYNSVPLVEYGSEELKSELLPKVADGEVSIQAFGLTEPNAGSDSTAIETTAERDSAEQRSADPRDAEASRDGDEYVVDGRKIWISRVDASDYILLMARTTPREAVDDRTLGMTMFLVDLDDAYEQGALETSMIDKTASNAVHSFELFFEGLRVTAENVVGEVGEGFRQMLDGLNEERLVIAAECVGLGEAALDAAADYANEREVFGRPIGQNQAIQHPLAEAYARVQAAKSVVYGAARSVEGENPTAVGARANTAKFLAADAAFDAADAAVQTHGGFGVAREYDVERFFREARLTRLVPITQELALNFLGENVLGLPRSY